MLAYQLFAFPSGLFVAFLKRNQSHSINPILLDFCARPFFSDRLNQNTFVYSQAEAVGWGKTSYGGPVSTNLQKVELTVIPNSECNKNYPYQISTAQMCTFSPMKDICDVSALHSPTFFSCNFAILHSLISYTFIFASPFFSNLIINNNKNAVWWRWSIAFHRHADRPVIFNWSFQLRRCLRYSNGPGTQPNDKLFELGISHHQRHCQLLYRLIAIYSANPANLHQRIFLPPTKYRIHSDA